MNKKDLYNDFLTYQELIEEQVGKKLEIATISHGIVGYQINPEVLNEVIDVLAQNGDISNDEKTKNIYKNSYLFARKVAYHDSFKGSRGLLYHQIMEELFGHAKQVIRGVSGFGMKNCDDDVIPFEYSECLSFHNQEELIDCFGLEDGQWKSPVFVAKKYGSNYQDKNFASFCSNFIDKLYQKNLKTKGLNR